MTARGIVQWKRFGNLYKATFVIYEWTFARLTVSIIFKFRKKRERKKKRKDHIWENEADNMRRFHRHSWVYHAC